MGRRKLLRETRICVLLGCNTSFECMETSKRKYCSPECSHKQFRIDRKDKTLFELGHKFDCNCIVCKAVRGETKGENAFWYGKQYTEEHKELLRKPHKGNSNWKLNKTHEELFGKEHAEEIADKNRKGHLGLKHTSESKEKNRKKAVKQWADPEHKEKHLKAIFKGLKLLPNKPEKFLIKLLQELFPNQWKYTGDGKNEDSFVAGKCPDFVHVNQKKIIEHFGDYHHGEKVTGIPNEQHEQERIDCFAQHGYQTLIIWEHELKDKNQVINKLKFFNYLIGEI